MPPEQPPFLVILDTTLSNHGLRSVAQYIEPQAQASHVRVRWGVGKPPAGFREEGGGVVFVADQTHDPRPPDSHPSVSEGAGRYTYSEGLNGAPWVMLVMLLPPGHTLVRPTPVPNGWRTFGNRMAVYWRLAAARTPNGVEVEWSLAQVGGDVGVGFEDALLQARSSFDSEESGVDHEVFLSYRREHDRWPAGRITDHLVKRLGPMAVFRDIHSIPVGRDFREIIDQAIGHCKIMLVVIGPNWLDPPCELGARRIDDANDWVRIEIESALQRHKPIAPLLLDNTAMPSPKLLPEPIRDLAYCQARVLREDGFEVGIDRLLDEVVTRLAGLSSE